jgi:ABC-2 type transport system permease protein
MQRWCWQCWAVTGRVLRELARSRRNLIFWTLFPALMLLLFGMIYAGGAGPARAFDRTAPGILIGAALFFSMLSGPLALLVAEREHGTLRRLLLSPLAPSAYCSGVALAFLAVAAWQALLVYGIAYTFGGRFHGDLLLGAALVLMSAMTYIGIGFCFGALFARRAEEVNGPVAAIGVPLLVLGGTFFPVAVLPPTLLAITHMNPVYHMNNALREVSADGAGLATIAPSAAFLLVTCLAALLAGGRAYAGLLRRERSGGVL